ncbi:MULTISPECIES: TetR/AcrR family transcriptional regulator [Rhodococcus]|nr:MULTISPECIES: TetR family transcriptional regulator [Rhodococcus]KAF0966686.1 hypothetical protein MLGJGCBP_00174 [Rhodococcus sp. T7]QQZ18312.1 TetR family transcriptional regulator [Rhodococcus sp. 21391]UOT08250.1 TetR family transcriptional regulator [Rhodococcus opacus]
MADNIAPGVPVIGRPRARARIPYAEATRSLLHQSILDAMGDLLRTKDWSEITMTHVAASAGVSRQTLYNEFQSRHGLAQGYALRLTDSFVEALDEAVYTNTGDMHGALLGGFSRFFAESGSDPLVQSLLTGDPKPDLLRLITVESAPLIERASGRLSTTFGHSWVQASTERAMVLAKAIARLAISYISMPPDSYGDVAEDMAKLLTPYVLASTPVVE